MRMLSTVCAAGVVGGLLLASGAAGAAAVPTGESSVGAVARELLRLADDRDRNRERYREEERHRGRAHPPGPPVHHGRPYRVPPQRLRHYRSIIIVRPYGHWYPGYGHYRVDDDAFKWLAFTAITLKILDLLNEQQQRAHEEAQIRATTAPVGETIYWHDGGATGAVTAVREGTSSSGRYCREFQQTVTIGGRTEQAYGTACLQPDGSWEVVSTGN